MKVIIDYFLYISNRFIEILDSLKFPGSSSILYYFLGAIIIGFIIKIVKGGSYEFEQNTNFLSSRIISTKASNYSMNNSERKAQIVKNNNDNAYRTGFVYGLASNNSLDVDWLATYDKGRKEAGF